MVTNRMCKDPQWREVLTEDCPNVCGFCMEGGCSDKAVDCTQDVSICMNVGMQDFVKEYCRKTCGFCRPTATTTTDPEFRGTSPDCVDYNTK
uniref:ShKT domain-containing protein n=1 Tax=Caenorhabditis japonica TaxID=281687 RepID=A0A8R1EU13_CAEJA